jgi:hypothetical protein
MGFATGEAELRGGDYLVSPSDRVLARAIGEAESAAGREIQVSPEVMTTLLS